MPLGTVRLAAARLLSVCQVMSFCDYLHLITLLNIIFSCLIHVKSMENELSKYRILGSNSSLINDTVMKLEKAHMPLNY